MAMDKPKTNHSGVVKIEPEVGIFYLVGRKLFFDCTGLAKVHAKHAKRYR